MLALGKRPREAGDSPMQMQMQMEPACSPHRCALSTMESPNSKRTRAHADAGAGSGTSSSAFLCSGGNAGARRTAALLSPPSRPLPSSPAPGR